MLVRNSIRTDLLKDIPVGSTFLKADGEGVVRLLKLDWKPEFDSYFCVTIGPHYSEDTVPTLQKVEGDDLVALEADIELAPKQYVGGRGMSSATSAEFGRMMISAKGKLVLCIRSGRSDKILIDIETSKPANGARLFGSFDSYVLIAPNELGKKQIIFDSSNQLP